MVASGHIRPQPASPSRERETSATQQEQMEAVPLCMSQEESSSSLQPPDENTLQCAGLWLGRNDTMPSS